MSTDEDTGLHLWEQIGIHLGNIDKRGERQERAWIQRASDVPRFTFVQFTGISPGTTTPFTLSSQDVGGVGPQAGETWFVRRIVIGGITPGTTVSTSSAEVFQQSSDPNQLGGTGPTVNWVASFPSLPAIQYFSNNQIALTSYDSLFISVLGPAQNAQIQANVQFSIIRAGTVTPEIEV